MKLLILYDCDPDGLAAACVIGNAYKGVSDSIEYQRAIRYQGPDLSNIDEETVVHIVDFCYKKEHMKSLCDKAFMVTVIDHHGESTLNDLDGFEAKNLTIINNTSHAACVLAWVYISNNTPDQAPDILKYIEDMDLWEWKLDNSGIMSAFLDSVQPNIESYMPFITGKISLDNVLELGQAVLNYKNKTMDILEAQAVLMNIAGHKVPAVNCSDPSIVSYLGNRLAKNQPFAATFYLQPNGLWKFSIRSITNETNPKGISVREIAQEFGGGGHENASGFKVDRLFPFELMEENKAHR
jgi:oligoribonuclease NrnB/cAMP/cGMP phosphodiesterase (DHH superfamily)